MGIYRFSFYTIFGLAKRAVLLLGISCLSLVLELSARQMSTKSSFFFFPNNIQISPDHLVCRRLIVDLLAVHRIPSKQAKPEEEVVLVYFDTAVIIGHFLWETTSIAFILPDGMSTGTLQCISLNSPLSLYIC